MTTERETLTAHDPRTVDRCPTCGKEPWQGIRFGEPDMMRIACCGLVVVTSDADTASDEWNCLCRATPPAGPVVWVARDEGQGQRTSVRFGDAPPAEGVDAEGLRVFGDAGAYYLDPDTAAALGLAPGECKRVRLTVEKT